MSQKLLKGVKLACRNPQNLAAWYTANLGMTSTVEGDKTFLFYDRNQFSIVLTQAAPGTPDYQASPNHRYWKVGVVVPDADVAYEQLAAKGIVKKGGKPSQFQDIGYLFHFADPEGFGTEVLQHTFEGQPKTAQGDPSKPLGGGASIGQLTLRTGDAEAECAAFQDPLTYGMKMLSIQPVEQYGFCLYFLAKTTEQPPNASDLKAVENRPWLWQRPYCTLEIQEKKGQTFESPAPNAPGYQGIYTE